MQYYFIPRQRVIIIPPNLWCASPAGVGPARIIYVPGNPYIGDPDVILCQTVGGRISTPRSEDFVAETTRRSPSSLGSSKDELFQGCRQPAGRGTQIYVSN